MNKIEAIELAHTLWLRGVPPEIILAVANMTEAEMVHALECEKKDLENGHPYTARSMYPYLRMLLRQKGVEIK